MALLPVFNRSTTTQQPITLLEFPYLARPIIRMSSLSALFVNDPNPIIFSSSVIFPPSNNPFIQARATATNSGVPGAIFRFASQLPNGPQSTFDLPNGFLDITRTVYVCCYNT